MWDFFCTFALSNNKVAFMNVEEIRDYCLSLGNSYEIVKAKYTKKK